MLTLVKGHPTTPRGIVVPQVLLPMAARTLTPATIELSVPRDAEFLYFEHYITAVVAAPQVLVNVFPLAPSGARLNDLLGSSNVQTTTGSYVTGFGIGADTHIDKYLNVLMHSGSNFEIVAQHNPLNPVEMTYSLTAWVF